MGLVDGVAYLDLDYGLDSRAQVDMNVVMTGNGKLIEVQGTGERASFSRDELTTLLDLGFTVLPRLIDMQKRAIATPVSAVPVVVRA